MSRRNTETQKLASAPLRRSSRQVAANAAVLQPTSAPITAHQSARPTRLTRKHLAQLESHGEASTPPQVSAVVAAAPDSSPSQPVPGFAPIPALVPAASAINTGGNASVSDFQPDNSFDFFDDHTSVLYQEVSYNESQDLSRRIGSHYSSPNYCPSPVPFNNQPFFEQPPPPLPTFNPLPIPAPNTLPVPPAEPPSHPPSAQPTGRRRVATAARTKELEKTRRLEDAQSADFEIIYSIKVLNNGARVTDLITLPASTDYIEVLAEISKRVKVRPNQLVVVWSADWSKGAKEWVRLDSDEAYTQLLKITRDKFVSHRTRGAGQVPPLKINLRDLDDEAAQRGKQKGKTKPVIALVPATGPDDDSPHLSSGKPAIEDKTAFATLCDKHECNDRGHGTKWCWVVTCGRDAGGHVAFDYPGMNKWNHYLQKHLATINIPHPVVAKEMFDLYGIQFPTAVKRFKKARREDEEGSWPVWPSDLPTGGWPDPLLPGSPLKPHRLDVVFNHTPSFSSTASQPHRHPPKASSVISISSTSTTADVKPITPSKSPIHAGANPPSNILTLVIWLRTIAGDIDKLPLVTDRDVVAHLAKQMEVDGFATLKELVLFGPIQLRESYGERNKLGVTLGLANRLISFATEDLQG